jgi:FKBP-type peptidyl-prolyl cis-trans isomerase
MKFSLVALVSLFFLSSCSKDENFLPYDEQLTKDIATIDKYLTDSAIVGAEKDPLGFSFLVTSTSSGLKPFLVDSIQAQYKVSSLSGEVYTKDIINKFLLGKMIKPLKLTLPLYGEGTKLTFFVPSGLAYGNYPTEGIPANTNLIFKIELKKVIREFSSQLQKDVAIIDTLLKLNTKIIRDGSGVRYQVSQGSGIIPTSSDSVVINYKGKFLSDPTIIFDQGAGKGFSLSKSTTPRSWRSVFTSFSLRCLWHY